MPRKIDDMPFDTITALNLTHNNLIDPFKLPMQKYTLYSTDLPPQANLSYYGEPESSRRNYSWPATPPPLPSQQQGSSVRSFNFDRLPLCGDVELNPGMEQTW